LVEALNPISKKEKKIGLKTEITFIPMAFWKGHYVQKIAEELGVSERTVKRYLSNRFKRVEKIRNFADRVSSPKNELQPENEITERIARAVEKGLLAILDDIPSYCKHY